MTVTSTKMIQSPSAWLTIVSDFFIKCASLCACIHLCNLHCILVLSDPPFIYFVGICGHQTWEGLFFGEYSRVVLAIIFWRLFDDYRQLANSWRGD